MFVTVKSTLMENNDTKKVNFKTGKYANITEVNTNG